MTAFPSIIPDHPASKEVRVRETLSPLGDGLEYVTRFGLNVLDVLWKLRWDYLTFTERDTIEAFLAARAADGQPFEWTPPDAATPQQFRVDEWQPAQERPLSCRMELTFRRVWEVAGGVIESITCAEDAEISDLPPDPLPPGTYEVEIDALVYNLYVCRGAEQVAACAIGIGGSNSGGVGFVTSIDNTSGVYSGLKIKVGAPLAWYCGRPVPADVSIYQTVVEGIRASDQALILITSTTLLTAWPTFGNQGAFSAKITFVEYALKAPATGEVFGPFEGFLEADFNLADMRSTAFPGWVSTLAYPTPGWETTLP
jgi:phage-related protein